ncbi:DUF6313 family protein [Actinocorallia sp. A-T 12471]|nr:DUF6313 family protein [Actinocorallia sp. A-T 12471]MDX6740183.1 DUF6313 family protein [Actinocorallia sp. A-T 12471]
MSTPPPDAGTGVDLPPPRPERPHEALRRRWRSIARYRGLRHWLLTRGSVVAVLYTGLFVGNGFAIGWRHAYDVSVGITSPAATSAPVVAWFLSVAGWLLAPGIAGAVAGYALSHAITSRRSVPFEEIFPPDADE